ncbi:MAG TPA: ROK family protein, partial [Candidatus Portnoybacteria bacterium]|nr:ROK family protein [Candidatus Portnoybacteria bacterium]
MSKNKSLIGVDLGATKIAIGVVRFTKERARVTNYLRIKTPRQKDKVIQSIISLVKERLNKEIVGLGNRLQILIVDQDGPEQKFLQKRRLVLGPLGQECLFRAH